MASDHELWLIGGGRMGSAFLKGWIATGFTQGSVIRVVEPSPSEALRAIVATGAAHFETAPYTMKPGRFIVLAVKPQFLTQALSEIRVLTRGAAILSIVAGRTIASIAADLGGAGDFVIQRAMPNTPAAVGKGVTTLYAGPEVDDRLRGVAERMMRAVGDVVWVEREELIDAATAISGSGPAYFYLLTEGLAEAGASIGLPRDVAERLARETLIGSGALLAAGGETPTAQRQAVTSPKGTTEAALKVLMASDGLPPLVRRAVDAALARAKELGKT